MKNNCWSLIQFGLLSLTVAASLSGQETYLLTGDANGNGHTHDSVVYDISANGRYALFLTGTPFSGTAPGINAGGLYIRDLALDRLRYVSGSSFATAGDGAVSNDGRYVVFRNSDDVLTSVDLLTGQTKIITLLSGLFARKPDGACRRPQISADGRFVAYATIARNLKVNAAHVPPGNAPYVVVWDRQSGEASVASLTSDGKALDLGFGGINAAFEFALSDDGSYLYFSSASTNVNAERAAASNQAWYWLYRRDLLSGEVEIVSKNQDGVVPSGNFTTPKVSFDGNKVLMVGAFVGGTSGPGLIDGYTNLFGTDLYVKDMNTGSVTRVSRTVDDAIPNGSFSGIDISADGTRVAFASTAKNLPDADDDNFFDVFLATIGSDDSVNISMLSKDPSGSENILFHDGPFATNTYVAFATSDWDIMTGQEGHTFNHTVAVGSLPEINKGAGGSFQLISTENSDRRAVAISDDGQKILLFSFNDGYQIGSPDAGFTTIPGTTDFVSSFALTTATDNLDMFAAEGTYNGTYGFVQWTESGGIAVLPEPPGWNTVSIRVLNVLNDGRVVFQSNDWNNNIHKYYFWSQENGYELFDISPVGESPQMEFMTTNGVAYGLTTVEDGINPPSKAIWQWKASDGFRIIGSPPEGATSSLDLVAVSPDGTTLTGNITVVPDGKFFTWSDASGFQIVANTNEIPTPTKLSPNGGMGTAKLTDALVWDESRGLRDLIDEFVQNGADASTFAGARIEEINQITTHDGKTLFLGGLRNPNNTITPFLASLPYVSEPSSGNSLPHFTNFFGENVAHVSNAWYWSATFDYIYVPDDSGWILLQEMNCWAYFNYNQGKLNNSAGLYVWLHDADGLAALGGGPDVPTTWVYFNQNYWTRSGTETGGYLYSASPIGGLQGWLIFAEGTDANRLFSATDSSSIIVRNPTPGF